jgi:hypothetical protein
MLVDPNGKGWVVGKGELVGRAEPKGDTQTSWRVARIREGDLVLVREDPSSATAAPETRVLAMRTEPQAEDRLEDD